MIIGLRGRRDGGVVRCVPILGLLLFDQPLLHAKDRGVDCLVILALGRQHPAKLYKHSFLKKDVDEAVQAIVENWIFRDVVVVEIMFPQGLIEQDRVVAARDR